MQSLTDNTLTANDAATVEQTKVTLRSSGQYRGLTPWQPGQSGNPRGRVNIGMTTIEWSNQMRTWTVDQLKDAMGDDQPTDKAIAARLLYHARCQYLSKGGVPIAGPELDRLLDRTLGKPVQQITSTSTSVEFTFDLGRLDDAGEAIAALPGPGDHGEIEADSVGQAALPPPDRTEPNGSVREDCQSDT